MIILGYKTLEELLYKNTSFKESNIYQKLDFLLFLALVIVNIVIFIFIVKKFKAIAKQMGKQKQEESKITKEEQKSIEIKN